MLSTYIRRGLFGLLFVALSTYVADSAVARYRAAHGKSVYGQVSVQQLDLVPQKNGRIQVLPDDTEQQECVHSVFPQLGDPPCWWLERHKEKRVNM